jgi:hypothetical protein
LSSQRDIDLLLRAELVERFDCGHELLALARVLVHLVKRIDELDEFGADFLRQIVRLLAERFERLRSAAAHPVALARGPAWQRGRKWQGQASVP